MQLPQLTLAEKPKMGGRSSSSRTVNRPLRAEGTLLFVTSGR